jgi:hypothetical protein
MLNERLQLLIKRSTNAIDNNKLLVQKLSTVESERNALRTVIHREKQRYTDIETFVHTSRLFPGNNLSPENILLNNKLVNSNNNLDTDDKIDIIDRTTMATVGNDTASVHS